MKTGASGPGGSSTGLGLGYALGAFFAWGFMPLYFKALGSVPPFELVLHRIVWTALLLTVLLTCTQRWGSFAKSVSKKRSALVLTLSSILICANWFLYILAMELQRVQEASLGYFITPLFSVLMAVLFLGEKLRPFQALSTVLAGIGLGYLILKTGTVPWLGLGLAVSFGLYGLLRKIVPVDPIVGLAAETFVLFPLGIAGLAWKSMTGGLEIDDTLQGFLILASGLVTAGPLLLFAAGVRALPLAIVGFFQYLSPSIQFALSVTVMGEPLDTGRLIGFLWIWAALLLFSGEAIWKWWVAREAAKALEKRDLVSRESLENHP